MPESPRFMRLFSLYSVCFMIASFCFVGFWVYSFANDIGWITHDRTVDLYMKGDWLVR